MAWCFSTRASVATVLTTHPCVSRCLRVNYQRGPVTNTFNVIAIHYHIDVFVQDCSISIANTLEILQSCTEPSIYWTLSKRLQYLQCVSNGDTAVITVSLPEDPTLCAHTFTLSISHIAVVLSESKTRERIISLSPEQHRWHSADDNFKCIFLKFK